MHDAIIAGICHPNAAFLVSRYALQEVIQTKFRRELRAINTRLQDRGATFVLLLRLLHAPFTFLNYAFGATPLKTRTFWWTTQLGILPGNLVFVFAGSQLPSLRQISRDGVGSILTGELVAVFILLSIIPLALPWIARILLLRMNRPTGQSAT